METNQSEITPPKKTRNKKNDSKDENRIKVKKEVENKVKKEVKNEGVNEGVNEVENKVLEILTGGVVWATVDVEWERIMQSFFIKGLRYVGLQEIECGQVEPVFFMATESIWSDDKTLPVRFFKHVARLDEEGITHYEPQWDDFLEEGVLTVAAMYNCMPFDAERDYTKK